MGGREGGEVSIDTEEGRKEGMRKEKRREGE